MDDVLNERIYEKHTIELVAVLNEWCGWLEKSLPDSKEAFYRTQQKFFALIYLKAAFLKPIPESDVVMEPQSIVTERDWQQLNNRLLQLLDAEDDFRDVNNITEQIPEICAGSLAETVADLYQLFKDFLYCFQTGVDDVMLAGLWRMEFLYRSEGGAKVLSALRVIHARLYEEEQALDPLSH